MVDQCKDFLWVKLKVQYFNFAHLGIINDVNMHFRAKWYFFADKM